MKKKGRKELKLNEVAEKQFTGPGRSDEREWRAWLDKDARGPGHDAKQEDSQGEAGSDSSNALGEDQ